MLDIILYVVNPCYIMYFGVVNGYTCACFITVAGVVVGAEEGRSLTTMTLMLQRICTKI